MASMNRNTNLEEINTDALMGIPFLMHQTFLQKVLFFGSVILGVVLNVCCISVFQMNALLSVFITLFPLLFGIANGCNYNEDLSLLQYIKLILRKPSKVYYSKSTEDIEYLRAAEERIRMEEMQKRLREQRATPEAQRKLLVKLVVGFVVAIVLFIVLIVVLLSTKSDEVLHHTVDLSAHLNEWEMRT